MNATHARPHPVSGGRESTRPAVSVVSPCYNGGRFIDRLLASLDRQTFRDFEVIVVDDGSDDGETPAKLDSLDPAVRIVRQENRGLPAARNAGIEAARAEFVLVIDCDDTIEPAYLAETVAAMRSAARDVAMVFSHTRHTGAAKGVVRRYFNAFDLHFKNTLPSCALLRKASWRAVGGYDETMREGYEDWEFYLRLARAEFRGVEVPKALYVYYISPTGMFLSGSSAKHAKLWRFMRSKHAEAYGLPAICRLWCANRRAYGTVTLPKALLAYALTIMLPDTWFNRLIGGMRSHKLASQTVADNSTAEGARKSALENA